MNDFEICYMLDFRKLPKNNIKCRRIYFGHETCEKRLPAFDEVQELLEISEKYRLELTFVTPFLTERCFEKVLLFMEQIHTAIHRTMEIVTSDWGLIHWMSVNKIGTPVAGRFITGQQLDFRLADAENKLSETMINHLSSCTLLKNKTLDMLHSLGVNRFELSNVFQTMTLSADHNISCSLHVPYVPLTIFRTCPENLDFNSIKKACNCNHNRQKWLHKPSDNAIFCFDNALYYFHSDFEPNLKLNRQIDRIIFHDLMYQA